MTRWQVDDRVRIIKLIPDDDGTPNEAPEEAIGRVGTVVDVYEDVYKPERSVYDVLLDDPVSDWGTIECFEEELDDVEDLDKAVMEAMQSIQAAALWRAGNE